MFLENDTLKLRAVEPEDLDLLYRWENDSSLWTTANTRVPYSRFQLKKYIDEASFDIFINGTLRLMMTDKITGKTVGTVDLFDFDIHNSRVALGLFVAGEFQGKGYAAQSLKLIEDYVFHFLKINQLYVQIAKTNTQSVRLFENNYELHGLLRNWIKTPEGFEDMLTFQKFG